LVEDSLQTLLGGELTALPRLPSWNFGGHTSEGRKRGKGKQKKKEGKKGERKVRKVERGLVVGK